MLYLDEFAIFFANMSSRSLILVCNDCDAVIRYDIETQTQTIISGVLTNIDIDESRSISMSLDMDNIPYIVFVNPEDNDKTYITYMDANRQWSDPQAVSTSSTDNPAIRFAEDGTGYIAYLDMTTNKFVLYTNIE